jgi:hypothetical protein
MFIPDPGSGFFFIPGPDPGAEKALVPGSGKLLIPILAITKK